MKLDLQYIDAWSLALDWQILLPGIPKVLTGRTEPSPPRLITQRPKMLLSES